MFQFQYPPPDYPFNRTILELKSVEIENMFRMLESFNRTILELKLCVSRESVSVYLLLIAPYWN